MPVTQRTVRTGVNPNVIRELDHPGEFMVSEIGIYQCRGNISVDGGAKGVPHNSVVGDATNGFKGIVFQGVPAGETALRGAIVRGPCEVSLAKLRFPEGVDGADAGSDTVAETAALRTQLIVAMRAVGIVVRD